MVGHALIERQVAALHMAIADLIRAGDSAPIERASANLERWRGRFDGHLPRAYQEWQDVLRARDVDRILAILQGDSEDAVRRRSSSPFTGVLDPRHRLQIMQSVISQHAA